MLKKTLALTLLNSHKKNYGQSLNTYTLSIFQVHKHFHPMSNNIKNMLILFDLLSLDSHQFLYFSSAKNGRTKILSFSSVTTKYVTIVTRWLR